MRSPHHTKTQRRVRRPDAPLRTPFARATSLASRRRGIVLIVVIALLGLLSIVGFTFFTFASQEEQNAEYFAGSEKDPTATGLDPDVLFDFALEQLILGADDAHPNSALYGGRWSMLPNMFGRDAYPYNGGGVNLVYDAGGSGVPAQFDVDQNHDLLPDNAQLLNPNDSLVAWSTTNAPASTPTDYQRYPEPDVDYTAADHNNMFLTFKGYSVDGNGRPVHVIRPAFHPVGTLRNKANYQPIAEAMTRDDGSAFSSIATRRRVFVPHQQHVAMVEGAATPTASNQFRFVTEADMPPMAPPIQDANGVAQITGPYPFAIENQGVWNMTQYNPSATYNAGDWVFPDTGHNGWYYECTTGGAAGTAPSPWPQSEGATFGAGAQFVAHSQPQYNFGANPDGDDVNEAVVLDLGYPIQALPDGRTFVPLFSFSVYDTEGLLNLAATGNLNDNVTVADMLSNPGNVTAFVHASNEGHSTFEINPLYALNADPANAADRDSADTAADVMEQHNANLGHSAANGRVLISANAELLFLMTGRTQFSGSTATDVHPGRHGEQNLMQAAYASNNLTNLPKAGVTGVDDDNNESQQEELPVTPLNLDPLSVNFFPYTTIPWKTPMDFTGRGLPYDIDPLGTPSITPWRTGVVFSGGTPVANATPGAQTIFYTRYFNFYSAAPPGPNPAAGGVPKVGHLFGLDGYRNPSNDNLSFKDFTLLNTQRGALADDPAELVTDPLFVSSNYIRPDSPQVQQDDNFDFADGGALPLSDLDLVRTGATSRIFQLAPWNFERSTRADQIRDRFTTTSYDPVLMSMPVTGSLDPALGYRRTGREWETHNPADTTIAPYFPFVDFPAPFVSPFRRATFELLVSASANDPAYGRFANSLPKWRTQRRLNLTQVAKWDSTNNTVFFRDPIAHPVNPAADATSAEQAKLARLDRQQMARDIYTLLYLYCGGREGVNYMTTPNIVTDSAPNTNGGLYTWNQLKEMAQFAINYVNMIDPDHVIDFFEYDTNLADGWDLDDDVRSDDELSNPAVIAGERNRVAGIEEQHLCLSEALMVKTLAIEEMMVREDHKATRFSDENDRRYLFVELQNVGLKPVPLGTDPMSWRVIVAPGGAVERVFYPRAPASDSDRTVVAGGRFMFYTTSDTTDVLGGEPSSDFVVDPEFDSGAMPADDPNPDDPDQRLRVIPHYPIGRPLPAGTEMVDIIREGATLPAANRRVLVYEGRGDGAAEVDAQSSPLNILPQEMEPVGEYTVILQRRANTSLGSPTTNPGSPRNGQTNDFNPWVEVDRMRVDEMKQFDLGTKNLPQADFHTRLKGLRSQAREFALQALDAETAEQPYLGNNPDTPPAQRVVHNTFPSRNESDGFDGSGWTPYQFWPDRPPLSRIELLSVPIYGPDEVTKHATWKGTDVEDPSVEGLAGPARFTRPQFEENHGLDGTTGYDQTLNNRWYRLLNFVEVYGSRRTQVSLPDFTAGTAAPLPWRRAGLINWNTVRHPEVWAGLLDDTRAFSPGDNDPSTPDGFNRLDVDASDDNNTHPVAGTLFPHYLPDWSEGVRRDWWAQLLVSRDRFDPTSQLYLPGTPGSRPFRDFGYLGASMQTLEGGSDGVEENGLEHTLLRSLPADEGVTDKPLRVRRRRLLDMRSSGDAQQDLVGGGSAGVDVHTRHRLLSKVIKNSTIRSNTFYVFIQVEFYEAAQVDLDGDPMTPETAVRIGQKMADSPKYRGLFIVDRSRAYSIIDQSHFRDATDNTAAFALRNSSDSGGRGFPWRNLVLFRQRLEE